MFSKNKISAIILLSGYSKRMGENKLLINLEGRMIFQYVFDVIAKADFFEVIAVARDEVVLRNAEDYGFKVVENNDAYKGISSSIKKGVGYSGKDSDAYMFFQGDQIFITNEDIIKIAESFKKGYIVVPKYNDVIGSPCIFSSVFKNHLLELKDEESGKKIISSFKDSVIYSYINNKYAFFDIDDSKSLQEAKNILLK